MVFEIIFISIVGLFSVVFAIMVNEIIPRKKFIDGLWHGFKDPFSFRFKNKDFTIYVETVYDDAYMSIKDVYINEELACRTYELSRIFGTFRYVNIKNHKSELELYKIGKYASEAYIHKEVEENRDKNGSYSYFD